MFLSQPLGFTPHSPLKEQTILPSSHHDGRPVLEFNSRPKDAENNPHLPASLQLGTKGHEGDKIPVIDFRRATDDDAMLVDDLSNGGQRNHDYQVVES